MGGTTPIPASQVYGHAEQIKADLMPLCEQISIAGSLRRGKAMVGDVELVAHPKQASALLARLDSWVIENKIYRAKYNKDSNRWGSKYRGFVYQGIRFELFIADEHNWGYHLWLRTGPGEANRFVMQQLIFQKAPYKPEGGDWWFEGNKVHIPDENELFRLLGMAVAIPPAYRTLETYHKYMRNVKWADQVVVVPTEQAPVQGQLL